MNKTIPKYLLWMGASILLFCLLMISIAWPHDRHYAIDSNMKSWFDGLKSNKGPCCSDADGSVVKDVDWESTAGHYRVRLNGNWIDVPDDAVIKEPNLYGQTMVWPLRGIAGVTIRCFIPGSMM